MDIMWQSGAQGFLAPQVSLLIAKNDHRVRKGGMHLVRFHVDPNEPKAAKSQAAEALQFTTGGFGMVRIPGLWEFLQIQAPGWFGRVARPSNFKFAADPRESGFQGGAGGVHKLVVGASADTGEDIKECTPVAHN
jgi:hypothetical protein